MQKNGDGKGRREPLLTMADVARLWNVHYMTVYRLVRDGQLRAVMMGNRYRFSHEIIEGYIRKHTIN